MSIISDVTEHLIEQSSTVVAGKAEQVRMVWVALLCGGHVLLEDLPGVGKTSLAQSLGALLGLEHQRVQFTADLLPSDIIGAQIFDREKQEFRFHQGAIFTQLLLADELNRATPKAQSALLEAMEEGQVSVDGDSRVLPQPFFVIATQNPQSQSGTYPLPESQLDRFFIRLSLGYPDVDTEKQLLLGKVGRSQIKQLKPLFSLEQLQMMISKVDKVKVSDSVLDYIMRLVQHSRDASVCSLGLSPRGSQALAQASRAYALTLNRDYVLPDDVQAVFPAIAGHRLKAHRSLSTDALVNQILETVDVLAES